MGVCMVVVEADQRPGRQNVTLVQTGENGRARLPISHIAYPTVPCVPILPFSSTGPVKGQTRHIVFLIIITQGTRDTYLLIFCASTRKPRTLSPSQRGLFIPQENPKESGCQASHNHSLDPALGRNEVMVRRK